MKNSKTLFQDFVGKIMLPESNDEIQSMAYLVFEKIFGLTRAEIFTEKEVRDVALIDKLDDIVKRINNYEPIQYILEEAWFFGRPFVVNPSVLIPRPETEELVQLVIDFVRQSSKKTLRIVDVGTGSGCIAVTLSLAFPEAEVIAIDVSTSALKVAGANSQKLGAKVILRHLDILADKLPAAVDVIVSNPPYIAWEERVNMSRNVTAYEPSLALFVDSKDPLLFYKAIVHRAKESLNFNALLAVEINERFGNDVFQLFKEHKFSHVAISKDVFGKDRIVKGITFNLPNPV